MPVPVRAVTSLSEYAGRYAHGESVVTFTEVEGRLYVRPINWGGRQPIERAGTDRFQMEQRPQRSYTFARDRAGRVTSVDVAGMDDNGRFVRLGRAQRMPLEALAAGNGPAAWAGFRKRGVAARDALALARPLFDRRAASASPFLAFMEAMARDGHRDPATLSSLGLARIAAGDRVGARDALVAAARAGDDDARRALRMLERGDDTGDRPLPFRLAEAYAPPSAAEIARVEAAWAARDLSPRDVRVEDSFRLTDADAVFDVEVISHLVHGSRHYGAILAPAQAPPHGCAVLLEVKGVSWNFSPLEVPRGSTAVRILGGDASRFVILLPGLRGETLEANGRRYTSEGDPAETWDGAADDAIAFLDVALARAAAADPARISVFGRSRGGTVALLVGERDPRVERVLAWSAPSGWIEGMPSHGVTQREIVAEGLRARSAPNEIGGQSVRTFLRKAEDGETLERVRDRLIASSPEYFVRRLPRTQAHWGADDPIVEPANARRIQAAAASAAAPVEVLVHPEGGHDLDPALAWPMSKRFLLDGAGR